MTLVDTSVWVDHLRNNNDELAKILNEGTVLMHPFVIEELACGSLSDRQTFVGLLEALPVAPIAEHEEVLKLITNEKLYGTGLGCVDAHLIASALLAGSTLWSLDKALLHGAARLGIGKRTTSGSRSS